VRQRRGRGVGLKGDRVHYGAEHTYGARADDSWTYRGLRTVIIENELLRATVLAGKGADVCSLVYKPTDTEFFWRTPWGARDPATHVPTTGSGSALWVDFYEGGWQSVFPNGGNPSSYANADLGIHGDSATTPWDATVTEEGPLRASATFKVRLARTPFVASRTVSIESGVPTLVVAETVTNVGAQPFATSYGQHITFGPPFLSHECVVDLPGGVVHAQPVPYSPNHRLLADARAEWPHAVLQDGSTTSLREIPPVGTGCEDMAYIEGIEDGWYAVTNCELGVGLAVRYPADLYRYLWYWQVFSGGSGYPWWGRTYNIGLEPFTSATNQGIEAAIADGSAVMLGPGESLSSELRLSAYVSSRGVGGVDGDGRVSVLEAGTDGVEGPAAPTGPVEG
jgi:hypothetical protein